MKLILPVPPSWNASYRQGKGHFYTPQSILVFRQQVIVAAKNARVRKFPREVRVCLTVSWFRKRQAGDLDKRLSVLQDALQDVWYVNDQQVAELHCYRFEDATHPRLEVEVHAIEEKVA